MYSLFKDDASCAAVPASSSPQEKNDNSKASKRGRDESAFIAPFFTSSQSPQQLL